MNQVTVYAYAKINLFLEVGERLENGYHNLESVMQSVDLKDTVKITKTQNGKTEVTSTLESLPTDGTNLVCKAANAFFEYTGVENQGIKFHIEKNIPVGAGLAGGSADAAAVLIGMNELYGTELDEGTLCKIGKTVGADVPFCIKKGTCLAGGIGEVLHRLSALPKCVIVIALGSERISTKWAFEQLDLKADRKIKKIDSFMSALKTSKIKFISENLYNVFETVSPHKHRIKEIMSEYNPNKSLMSGSGPSVFSLFEDESSAYAAAERLRGEQFETFVCQPLNMA